LLCTFVELLLRRLFFSASQALVQESD
jgi:hypothetical protein